MKPANDYLKTIDKYIILLLTSTILNCSIYPAWGQENPNLEITFTYKNKDSIPITVAKNNPGKTKTIFYWKEEAIALIGVRQSSSEFCDRVAKKFNEYATDGHNLSSFTLQSFDLKWVDYLSYVQVLATLVKFSFMYFLTKKNLARF